MSEPEPVDTDSRVRSFLEGNLVWAWVIGPLLLLPILVVVVFFRSTGPEGPLENEKEVAKESPLTGIRDSLARQPDLPTCRAAISQLNVHLQKVPPDDRPAPLSAEQLSRARAALALDDEDLEELNSLRFTPLDAAHLETCFLLRDAAQSLELTNRATRLEQSPLERARLAFDWVCRQVSLASPPFDFSGPMQGWFRNADQKSDGDGFLTRDEVKDDLIFGGNFSVFDSNGDGKLSLSETLDSLDRLPPAPPGFVLRRGSGTALERAVTFLALLEQLGLSQDRKADLQGCLLFVPGRGKQPTLWACGVVLANEPELADFDPWNALPWSKPRPAYEPTPIYLFDPRLGMPLPGPNGIGIATLKQARDDPSVLAQLQVDDVKYDVTAQKAKDAEALICVPLTALAPRMRLMQDRLLRDPVWRDAEGKERPLPPAIRVKLAEDEPGALDTVRGAFVASGGNSENVRYWRDGGKLLRTFVAKADGGSELRVPFAFNMLQGFAHPNDTTISPLPRALALELANVPWEDFPEIFRTSFAGIELRFDTGPGAGVRNAFAGPFIVWFREPGSAREMVVRGQFLRAARDLSKEQESWDLAKRRGLPLEQVRKGPRAWDKALLKGVEDWVKAAFNAHGDAPPPRPGQAVQMTPELLKVYQWRLGEPMDVLMSGATAEGRGAQVTYQLALCKHEQAVRSQVRLALAVQAGKKTDEDEMKVREAWEQTAEQWKFFLEHFGKRPIEDEKKVREAWEQRTAAARQLLGEAKLSIARSSASDQERQRQTAEAVKLWTEGTSSAEANLEQLGLLWRARQLKP